MILRAAWCLSLAVLTQASSSQRKYDGSTLSYDPKGRIYQVEYAMEATRRGRTVIGVCDDECVALVTRDPSSTNSCRAVSSPSVWQVDTHVGLGASGLRSDVQYVVDCARTWCAEHRFVFGTPMPCHMLARRIADLIHACTTRGGKRPLAVHVLLAGVDEFSGTSLHEVQATGAFQRYRAAAVGRGASAVSKSLANAPSWLVSAASRDTEACEAPNESFEKNEVRAEGEDARGALGHGAAAEGVDIGGIGSGGKTGLHADKEGERVREAGLPPRFRAALREALAALWETENDNASEASAGRGSIPEASHETKLRGRSPGGLALSELSAVVYAKDSASARWGTPALGGEKGNRRFEYHGDGLHSLLMELEAEEVRDRHGKRGTDSRD